MRHYETLFIVTPDSSDSERTAVEEKFRAVIGNNNGILLSYEEMGKKKLAYEVRKHSKGIYVLMEYAGDAGVVAELERNLRLDDRILKYITVKLADEIDLEAVKQQAEARRQARPAPVDEDMDEGEEVTAGEDTDTESKEEGEAETEEEEKKAEAAE